MKIRFGLVLAMVFGFALTGCASGGGGGGGMSGLSGAGAGLNPRNTDNTRAAEDAIEAAEESTDPAEADQLYAQAKQFAEMAIQEDTLNPLAYRLAGVASIGTDDYTQAGGYFDKAIELRPLYEFDLVSVRERAWIDLYQEGSPYVQQGDYETATRYFEWANDIYSGRPEASVILGQVYAQLREHDAAIENLDAALAFADSETMMQADSATAASWREQLEPLPLLRAQVLADAGRFEQAVGTYRQMSAANPDDVELKRGLAAILMEMGNEAEATAVYMDMMEMPGLDSETLFSIGVGFYQSSDYVNAATAFGNASIASVNDRDALEMWARSLQLDSAYADIPAVAERWIDLDPHGQNGWLILAQAANQIGDSETTQEAIQSVDALDFIVNDLQLRRFGNGGAEVNGSVINKQLSQGDTVTLRFTFYADDGTPIGSVTETVTVGGVDMAQVFNIQFDSAERVGGYGYRAN
ncbi:MAG: tetratricopeptide repeat protein [Longimicrobiales bacterium]